MEIEHKHLVVSDAFRQDAVRVHHIEQGYLSILPTVRIRIRDSEAFITIKGPTDPTGLSREEYEYAIPLAEARALIGLCEGRTLIKDRYLVPHQGNLWEVDVFAGRHSGLVLAELEVPSLETTYPLPDWAGEEVTGQPQYYNAYMALN